MFLFIKGDYLYCNFKYIVFVVWLLVAMMYCLKKSSIFVFLLLSLRLLKGFMVFIII